MIKAVTNQIEQDADAAYNREDQAWFDSQTTEVLTSLWAIACDINAGAAWDDEVYDALAKRGHFDTAKPAKPETKRIVIESREGADTADEIESKLLYLERHADGPHGLDVLREALALALTRWPETFWVTDAN